MGKDWFKYATQIPADWLREPVGADLNLPSRSDLEDNAEYAAVQRHATSVNSVFWIIIAWQFLF